jgi:hypothetical protein
VAIAQDKEGFMVLRSGTKCNVYEELTKYETTGLRK